MTLLQILHKIVFNLKVLVKSILYQDDNFLRNSLSINGLNIVLVENEGILKCRIIKFRVQKDL